MGIRLEGGGMNYKCAGLFFLGAAVGAVCMTVIQHPTSQQISRETDDTSRQSERLQADASGFPGRSTELPPARSEGDDGRVSVVAEDDTRELTGMGLAEMEEWRLKREAERLLAAGFSLERIEWLRHRADELRIEQEREADELRRRGVAPDPRSFAYIFDEDLRLREEVGLDEYERYRQALGRPMGVGIAEVLPGSIAEQAGLRADDEIVSYGGARVFNFAELSPLVLEGTVGEPVLVEVRRDGQTMQLAIPRGSLGVRHKLHTSPLGSLGKKLDNQGEK